VRGDGGTGKKSVLTCEAIDQSLLCGTQNLLRETGEISEGPQQASTFEEAWLQVTGTDWGVQLEDTAHEFVNPHCEAYLGSFKFQLF